MGQRTLELSQGAVPCLRRRWPFEGALGRKQAFGSDFPTFLSITRKQHRDKGTPQFWNPKAIRTWKETLMSSSQVLVNTWAIKTIKDKLMVKSVFTSSHSYLDQTIFHGQQNQCSAFKLKPYTRQDSCHRQPHEYVSSWQRWAESNHASTWVLSVLQDGSALSVLHPCPVSLTHG